MNEQELKNRSKAMALRVIAMVESLPKTKASFVISNQILRSATSVGANYRAVCRAKSKPDFISKMAIVVEEADETLYWMELLVESGRISKNRLDALMKEVDELVAIFTASLKTAKTNRL